jgi:antitoxin VapB
LRFASWVQHAYFAREIGSTIAKRVSVESKEVEIFRRGDEIVLREKAETTKRACDLLTGLPDDFEIPDRSNDPPQKRKGL